MPDRSPAAGGENSFASLYAKSVDDTRKKFVTQLAAFGYTVSRGSEDDYWTFCPGHESTGGHDPSLHISDDGERFTTYCPVCRRSFYTEILKGEIPHCSAVVDQRQVRANLRRGPNARISSWQIRSEGDYYRWCHQQGTLTEFGYPAEQTSYVYDDGQYIKVRWSDKNFTWLTRVSAGYLSGIRGGRSPGLYGGDSAASDGILYGVEGEKDVDTLRSHGFAAVSYTYVGTPSDQLFAPFAGRDVVLLQDNDSHGASHVGRFRQLAGHLVRSLRVIPPLADVRGYDVSDWFADGGTAEELVSLHQDLAYEILPQEPASAEETDPWASVDLTQTPDRDLARWGTGDTMYREPCITWVAGESESGKSIFVYSQMLQMMQSGQRTMLLDEEAGRNDVYDKMTALGATDGLLQTMLDYLPPEGRNVVEDRKLLFDKVRSGNVKMVVFDSATDHLEAAELDDYRGADINVFAKRVLRPLRAMGVHCVVIDHKDKSNVKGRYATGASRKLGVSDLAYNFAAVTPFSRDRSGSVTIACTKDKFGVIGRGSDTDMIVETGGSLSFVAKGAVRPATEKTLAEQSKRDTAARANEQAVITALLEEQTGRFLDDATGADDERLWVTTSAISNEMKKPGGVITRRLEEMFESGLLRRRTNPRRKDSVQWALPVGGAGAESTAA